MIAKRRKPLTQDQIQQAYALYTASPQIWTMKALALMYDTSTSVIHRALHREAYARGLSLTNK